MFEVVAIVVVDASPAGHDTLNNTVSNYNNIVMELCTHDNIEQYHTYLTEVVPHNFFVLLFRRNFATKFFPVELNKQ